MVSNQDKNVKRFTWLTAFMVAALLLLLMAMPPRLVAGIKASSHGVRISFNNATQTDTAYMGINLSATTCIDPGLGEEEIPPFPPSGVICAAFNEQACLGNGLKFDLHQGTNNPSTVDTFRLKIQLADESVNSASFTWPNSTLGQYVNYAYLTAGTSTINMVTDSIFEWNPNDVAIGSVRMIIDWKSMSDTADGSEGDLGLAGVRIKLTNDGVSDTAFFGVNASATKCIDPSLGEEEVPPFPPSGVMNIAFTELSCLGNGLRFNLHPVAAPDTFRLKVQLANENATTASLTWSSSRLAQFANSATISGGGSDVNMLLNSEFFWNPTDVSISTFRILVNWKTSNDSLHPPVITSFAPESGPVGTSVTIHGKYFGATQGLSTVNFGPIMASPTSWSDSQIVAPVPYGAVGLKTIFVTVGITTVASADTFNVIAGPPTVHGIRLTLTNDNQNDTTFFGTHPLATNCIDPSLGEEEAPPFPPSGVMSSAFTEFQCLGNGLKYDLHPVAAHDSFKLKIQLGDENASTASLHWSASSLGLIASSATISGGGMSINMLTDSAFDWNPSAVSIASLKIVVSWLGGIDSATHPVISSFSPTQGPVGAMVTINGNGFGASRGSSMVAFGGVNAIPTHWSNTQITAPVPQIGAGMVYITVTVGGDTAASSTSFLVLPPPPPEGLAGARLTLTNGGATDTAFFGAHPLATKCIDPSLGEEEGPPFPPSGIMNIAFNELPCLGEGLKFDLHPPAAADTFRLKIQLADENASSASLAWSASRLGHFANSATLSAGAHSMNMLTDSIYSWDPTVVSISSFKVYVSWKTPPDSGHHLAIDSFAPMSGPVGTVVTIHGHLFGAPMGSSTVAFGSIQGSPSFWNDSTIIVPVPQSASGASPIYVMVGGHTVMSAMNFTVTVPPPPGTSGVRLTFANGGQTDTAFFGINAAATKCIDAALGEEEVPPFPPAGAMFMAFTEFSCLGNGLKFDLHPGYDAPSTLDTFKLKLQAADENATTASITWPRLTLAHFVNSASMSGGGITVNMLTDSVFAWDPTNITVGTVRILVNWKNINGGGHSDSSAATLRLMLTNASQSDTATFGFHPLATKCIDPALGEEEGPPFPPAGVMYTAFTDYACLGEGIKWDLHPIPAPGVARDTFKLKIQLANENVTEAKITWSHAGLDRFRILPGTLSIRMTGGGFSVNMLTDSVFMWDPSANSITSVKIIIELNPTGVGSEPLQVPSTFALGQNYPNPFNPTTVMTYQLPQEASVRLSVYNVLGQEVRVLVNGIQEAGEKSVTFDASGLTTGIYIYRLQAISISDPTKRINESKKLLLVK